MDKKTISNRLDSLGISFGKIEYGWLGNAGPGIHIIGTDFYALLPINDGSDEEFAKWVVNTVNKSDHS